jgi:hypothetical protein
MHPPPQFRAGTVVLPVSACLRLRNVNIYRVCMVRRGWVHNLEVGYVSCSISNHVPFLADFRREISDWVIPTSEKQSTRRGENDTEEQSWDSQSVS